MTYGYSIMVDEHEIDYIHQCYDRYNNHDVSLTVYDMFNVIQTNIEGKVHLQTEQDPPYNCLIIDKNPYDAYEILDNLKKIFEYKGSLVSAEIRVFHTDLKGGTHTLCLTNKSKINRVVAVHLSKLSELQYALNGLLFDDIYWVVSPTKQQLMLTKHMETKDVQTFYTSEEN